MTTVAITALVLAVLSAILWPSPRPVLIFAAIALIAAAMKALP